MWHVSISWFGHIVQFGLGCVNGQKMFSSGFPYVGRIQILRFCDLCIMCARNSNARSDFLFCDVVFSPLNLLYYVGDKHFIGVMCWDE